jgi:uncharacterized membrane protein
MNTVIWIVQGLTGALFMMAGLMKLLQSKAKLEAILPWIKEYSLSLVRLIGLAELLGGLGTILPTATGIATGLTPVAGMGLAIIMTFAAIFHIRRNEMKALPVNAVLFVCCGIVVCGRI